MCAAWHSTRGATAYKYLDCCVARLVEFVGAMARKAVRSPFVVTVSVMVSAAACGGQVSGEKADPTVTTTTDAAPDIENPPPLPTMTCPTVQPELGSKCRVDSSVYCNYGTCSSSSRPVTMKCEVDPATSSEVWRESGGTSCNPPPVCPAEPYEGAPCKPGFGDCRYPDMCDARPSPHYTDTTSWWCAGDKLRRSVKTTDYVVACPATAPRDGDPCLCAGHYAAPCSYGDCGGSPTINARCDEKTNKWSVATLSCNPPPADAGI